MRPCFLPFIIFLLCNSPLNTHSSLQTYIVHVSFPQDEDSGKFPNLEDRYHSFLPESAANSGEPSRMRHMYRNVVTGFAAKLSPEEVKDMAKIKGFLHARPEKKYSLHTTGSPGFLGLYHNSGSWPRSNYGKGVIIGVLDGGFTPGHPSFNDEGVPPPPARWKGKCEFKGIGCNNKIIGARNLVRDEPGPPVEHNDGHGTHTASTAAGNFVPGASVFRQVNGTASGMAPLAHLAIYKVCSLESCPESDILAGLDAAIEDGVDVLSVSLGAESQPFYEDGMAIGAFQAIQKGIFVSCSAANSGPRRASLSNESPWILTVGASSIGRHVVATVLLGNNDEYNGESLNQMEKLPSTLLPLVYPGSHGNKAARWCAPGSLDGVDVKGKVVLCMRGGEISRIDKGQTVKDAGGAAMIMMNDKANGYNTLADPHVLPASHVSYAAGKKIQAYISSSSNSNPTTTIVFKGTMLGDKMAPIVESYSSRGPNLVSPGILKPDIIGPGSSIIAAWPKSVDNLTNEKGRTFNVLSGTSMSCPHLSGIAALIKSVHPDWSPAMIKSAMMTSATQKNRKNRPIVEQRDRPAKVFAIGAGHVEPTMALDPGLVYDIKTRDYISYLCFMYNEMQVEAIVQKRIDCHKKYKGIPEAQLNLPSIAVQLGHDGQKYSRTVTNVGRANSSYSVRIERVSHVNVTVYPTVLIFNKMNQKKMYKVYFKREEFKKNGSYVQGSIAWISSKHTVRIPISVHLVL